MKWFAHILQILPMIPSIVSGIELIHGNEMNGASKKELAMQSLGLSSAVAAAALPEDQAAIQAATSLASTSIDGVVALLNATKQMPKPLSLPVPAPVKV
jgi:hypothetical protein